MSDELVVYVGFERRPEIPDGLPIEGSVSSGIRIPIYGASGLAATLKTEANRLLENLCAGMTDNEQVAKAASLTP